MLPGPFSSSVSRIRVHVVQHAPRGVCNSWSMSKPRLFLLIALAFVVLIVAAIATYVTLANRNAPDALDSTSQVSGMPFEPDQLSGVWTVDADSVAGYRVDEVLAGQDVTVVGRTSSVQGRAIIENSQLTSADVSVSLADIATDNSNRDDAFRELLQVDQFPTARFQVTEPVDLSGATPEGDGESVRVSVPGTLTVSGGTVDVTASILATVHSDGVTLAGSIPVTFADFGIDAPDLGFVTVEDQGTVEFSLEMSK